MTRPVALAGVAAGLDELPGGAERDFWTRVFVRAGASELEFADTNARRVA